MNFLETIVATKRAEVERAKQNLSLDELIGLASELRPKNDFRGRLFRGSADPVRVIAEIKRASPSKGMIATDIDPASVAMQYFRGGAAAVSVLTESTFFKGSSKDFQEVREAVPRIPLLRKDFIVDEYQIYESALMGADAILLIVAALDRATLIDFERISDECGLAALVEVHDEAELETALSSGAENIGVNNRNLVSFDVSQRASERIAGLMPENVVSVSESGISDLEGVKVAEDLGYHAVLIGEHFMRAANRESEVRKFSGKDGLR